MAQKCELCERKATKDATRSHSNRQTLRRQYVNLQTKKVGGQTLKVCTRCIKTMSKVRKVKAAKPAMAAAK